MKALASPLDGRVSAAFTLGRPILLGVEGMAVYFRGSADQAGLYELGMLV